MITSLSSVWSESDSDQFVAVRIVRIASVIYALPLARLFACKIFLLCEGFSKGIIEFLSATRWLAATAKSPGASKFVIMVCLTVKLIREV